MKKVMLAMSGGVDSSVSLVLLKDKYEVIGATLKLYDNEDIGDRKGSCCSLSDIDDARIVANKFGLPHYVFNFKDRFRKDVIERFIDSYLRAETPNPCIECNRYIKFSAMMERAKSLECDYLATGHYARIDFDESSGRWLLKKAIDEINGNSENSKDQSYVLYNLTQEQLAHTLFPLGAMKKSDARKIADEYELVNANKPDSQDICFVPDGDYAGFIERSTGKRAQNGNFIGTDGKILGKHNGIIRYTVGQRKGLGIAFGTPTYVIDKIAVDNTVILGSSEQLFKKTLTAYDVNLISIEKLEAPMKCKAKTRYKQTEQPCTISPLENGEIFVEFDEPQRAITSGQAIVFYDSDIVVGGGKIK